MMKAEQQAFEQQLKEKTALVEQIIGRYLPPEQGCQKTIIQAMNYSMKAGGKRLRPLFMLEVCRLFKGSAAAVEPFMAAIEMIHCSSLVHDDLPCMDNDEYRRGMQSTWAKYGEAMGVLTGDSLIVEAFAVAAGALDNQELTREAGRSLGLLAEKTGVSGMIGGQVVDVELTGQSVAEERLDFIYRLKTGALLEASMAIGAVMAKASEEEIAAVTRMAAKVGMAFQIQDDILDVIGDRQVLGKPAGSDEKNKKTTYVTLKGLECARETVAALSAEAIDTLHSLGREHSFLEQLIKWLIYREK